VGVVHCGFVPRTLCHCFLVAALVSTFGSLYQDDVEITRKNVTGILAAATLFSLVCVFSSNVVPF